MTGNNFLGCAKLLYFIGESHCLPFRNVLYQSPSSADIFLGRVRFLRIPANRFTDEDGLIHGDIVKAMQAEQLMDDEGGPVHLAKDNQSRRTAEVSGVPQSVPPLVLFAGDLDIADTVRRLGNNLDFELPEDPGYGANHDLEPILYAALHAQVTKSFQPFFIGCKKLKDIGFSQLMIHGLPPRIRDTNKQLGSGMTAGPQVRAKLSLLGNRILRHACEDLGASFIDIWDSVTDEGYLRPNFCLVDGIHLNRAAALISLKQIAEKLAKLD